MDSQTQLHVFRLFRHSEVTFGGPQDAFIKYIPIKPPPEETTWAKNSISLISSIKCTLPNPSHSKFSQKFISML